MGLFEFNTNNNDKNIHRCLLHTPFVKQTMSLHFVVTGATDSLQQIYTMYNTTL